MLKVGIDLGMTDLKFVILSNDNKIIEMKRFTKPNSVQEKIETIVKEIQSQNSSVSLYITGVGAASLDMDKIKCPYHIVDEISSTGKGGLFLSGEEDALVVSMGTGTSFINASHQQCQHVGGLALGSGTLIGLSMQLVGIQNTIEIAEFASKGQLKNVDYLMADVSKEKVSFLPDDATASHFAKTDQNSSKEDVMRSLLNMIYQTVAVMAVTLKKDNQNVIIVGGLSSLPQAKVDILRVSDVYNVTYVLPNNGSFATAIGACL